MADKTAGGMVETGPGQRAEAGGGRKVAGAGAGGGREVAVERGLVINPVHTADIERIVIPEPAKQQRCAPCCSIL